jgi:uncharacterized protein
MILRFSSAGTALRKFHTSRERTAMPTRQVQSGAKLDAFRLAREHGVVEGSVDAHGLSRVADVLADGPADVAWRIEGSADAAGRPALAIEIAGSVPLICQRCLDDFDWPVAQRTEVLLAHDERELALLDADSSAEVVLAGAPVAALTLVEDELLLALPFSPRHPEGACGAH